MPFPAFYFHLPSPIPSPQCSSPKLPVCRMLRKSMLFRSFYGKLIFFCLFLGFACLLFFFTASGFISRRIFHTPEAGNYILTLAFICPFLYSNTALISVLNGLDLAGKNLFDQSVHPGSTNLWCSVSDSAVRDSWLSVGTACKPASYIWLLHVSPDKTRAIKNGRKSSLPNCSVRGLSVIFYHLTLKCD